MYLSGVSVGVNLRTDTTKTCIGKDIELCAQNMLTILDAIISIIRGAYMVV